MKYIISICVAIVLLFGISYFVANKNADAPDITTTSSQTEIKDTHTGPVDNGLDLSNRGLMKVPAYIFDYEYLESLNLSHNNLTGSLQAEVRFLSRLKVLNISNNKFTGVPAEVGQLKNLEVLDVSNNQITGLPMEIGNLSKLKTLILTGNDYSKSDLETIRKNLPKTTVIITE